MFWSVHIFLTQGIERLCFDFQKPLFAPWFAARYFTMTEAVVGISMNCSMSGPSEIRISVGVCLVSVLPTLLVVSFPKSAASWQLALTHPAILSSNHCDSTPSPSSTLAAASSVCPETTSPTNSVYPLQTNVTHLHPPTSRNRPLSPTAVLLRTEPPLNPFMMVSAHGLSTLGLNRTGKLVPLSPPSLLRLPTSRTAPVSIRFVRNA